jgi:hypothetical protein
MTWHHVAMVLTVAALIAFAIERHCDPSSVMAVSTFAGTVAGGIFGVVVQSRRIRESDGHSAADGSGTTQKGYTPHG